MSQIIAIIIALVVSIVGFIIYKIALELLDEGDYFFYAVGFFLLLFILGAVVLYFLLPRPMGPARLTSIAPLTLLQTITDLTTSSGGERALVFSDINGE